MDSSEVINTKSDASHRESSEAEMMILDQSLGYCLIGPREYMKR